MPHFYSWYLLKISVWSALNYDCYCFYFIVIINVLLLKGSEKTASKIDMKEGIYFGPDSGSHDADTTALEPMMGPNQFPDNKQLPGFATTINDYMDKMSSVG